MKLSFSTKGWHDVSFEAFCDMAEDVKFEGIELHNIYNPIFTDKDGAFHNYTAAATRRRLYEKKLQIPCIDTIGDIAEAETEDLAVKELDPPSSRTIRLAVRSMETAGPATLKFVEHICTWVTEHTHTEE